MDNVGLVSHISDRELCWVCGPNKSTTQVRITTRIRIQCWTLREIRELRHAALRIQCWTLREIMELHHAALRIQYFRSATWQNYLWTHSEVKWLSSRQISPRDYLFRNLLNIFVFEANVIDFGQKLTTITENSVGGVCNHCQQFVITVNSL
jgi:hypothetical protein